MTDHKALEHDLIDDFYELLDRMVHLPMDDRQALLANFGQACIDLIDDSHRKSLRLITPAPMTVAEAQTAVGRPQ